MKVTLIIISLFFQLVAYNTSAATTIQSMKPFVHHADSYIDDIPFDTEKVVETFHQNVFLAPLVDAAAYIDDIPFETEEVFAAVKATEAMKVNFQMQAEAQIEDIPFDTERISAQAIGTKISQIQFERMSK